MTETLKAKYLQDVITPGSWRGRRCFVVCGGPSLRGFDFSLLKDELTIGVNRAYERFTPTINFSMDSEFFSWADKGAFGPEAKKRWDSEEFLLVFLEIEHGMPFPPDILRMKWDREAKSPKWPDEKGMYAGPNSGFAALMLAAWLGSTEIYVLGLDAAVAPDGSKWHHDGYPSKSAGTKPERAIPYFEKLAPFFEQNGVKVTNLSPKSGVGCWPRMHWSKLWKTMFIQAHLGFGDNIYAVPFIQALANSGKFDRVYLKTPFPQLYTAESLRFLRCTSGLHTQTMSERSFNGYAENPGQFSEIFSMYHADAARRSMPRPERFEAALMPAGDEGMALNPDWCRKPLSIIRSADLDPEKGICVVKQPTIRNEWPAPSRNPDPEYLTLAMDRLRERFNLISVADLREGQEKLDGPKLDADLELLHGELDVFGVCGLVAYSQAVLTPPSFMIPLALELGKPVLAIYGGYERPEAHFSTHVYGENPQQLYVAPRPFCDCGKMVHGCSKSIPKERVLEAVDKMMGVAHAA